MEAFAMDRLIEKGGATPQLAQAIGEALDITIKAANLVTVPMLDARFAQCEAKLEVRFGAMEARFGSLERSIESAKVWAVLLYAGLIIVFFGALAVDHRWLLNREDQFLAQSNARFAADQAQSDARFAADQARSDARFAAETAQSNARFAAEEVRTDRLIAEQRARDEQADARSDARWDAKFDQLRSLILNRSQKP